MQVIKGMPSTSLILLQVRHEKKLWRKIMTKKIKKNITHFKVWLVSRKLRRLPGP